MKINWKLRFQSKTFLVALFSLLLLLAQQVGAIFGLDLTVYNDQVTSLFNTVLSIFVLLGVVVDGTTKGINDSEQAMSYTKRKG